MKALRFLVAFVLFSLAVYQATSVKAQCSVCSTNVASNVRNGGSQANGLNNGIMYLLAAPYIAITAVGFIWYKKYRRKNVSLNMRGEKLHLN